MAGKRLCALVSVSVLVALGLIAVVFSEPPVDRSAEAAPAPFATDESASTAQPVPAAAGLQNEPVHLQSSQRGPRKPLPVSDFLMDSPPTLAAPVQSGYGLETEPIDGVPGSTMR